MNLVKNQKTGKWIVYVDHSVLQTGCQRQLLMECFYGIRGFQETVTIAFGSVGHTFIDTTFKNEQPRVVEEALALKSFAKKRKKLTPAPAEMHLTDGYMYYFVHGYKSPYKVFRRGPSKMPATELTFSIPMGETKEFEIRLVGTLDRLIESECGKHLHICDTKFTKMFSRKKIFSPYEWSSQLMFYIIALRLFAESTDNNELREINSWIKGGRIEAILIGDKNKISPVLSNVFEFSEYQLDEHEWAIYTKIKKLKEWLKKYEEFKGSPEYIFPYADGNLNNCCTTKYGHCPHFKKFCSLPFSSIEEERKWINMLMKNTKPYEPLKFR